VAVTYRTVFNTVNVPCNCSTYTTFITIFLLIFVIRYWTDIFWPQFLDKFRGLNSLSTYTAYVVN